MKEVKEVAKTARKALIRLNTNECEGTNEGVSVNIDVQNPIYQALKLTPISELDYII